MSFIKRKKSIYILLVFSLIINILAFSQTCYNISAASVGKINDGVTGVNFREAPNGDIVTDSDGNGIRLNEGQELTILDTTNSAWYKVSVIYNGERYTGYVSSQFITITGEVEDTGYDADEAVELTDVNDDLNAASDFEASLQGFPESYKILLRDIHDKYPLWQFVPVQTGIDWNTLVDKEVNKSGQIKNLIYGAGSSPHYNWRSLSVGYSPATNTWYPYDGKTWFAASDEIVEYYLDPRTYLYENFIFVFESLSYQEGMQNEIGVESILSGSFMHDAVPENESKKYSEIIMEAANQSGVSPYHIASRIKQEMGNTPGAAALGTHPSYPGIYNYFNIGAFDTPDGSPVTKGLAWASAEGSYGRPWNTVSASIIGGSEYLGESYIKRGQDTLYTQKFNVTYAGNLFNHQYMSNIQAPASESQINYKAYKENNLLNSSMVFKIPVYKNMPETACVKPADSGNPNNWLGSLDISGYSITPTFAVNNVTEYSLIVDSSVSSINIMASPVASTSTVSGAGKINLEKGTNYIKINVTSQTGLTRTYTLTVVRGKASDGSTNIDNTDTTTESPNNATETDSDVTKINGDINGDGKITVLDIVKIQRIIVGLDDLDDAMTKACDLNGDGKVTVLDIVKLQRHIVGIENIN
ncbi:MAG: cadherin-like beta sandwich domain-containing protein [Lachnospiraceae bacterium]|nr:cadherin-like beta sandwich domain-containing protein [Lachnospiraceae bacterium]